MISAFGDELQEMFATMRFWTVFIVAVVLMLIGIYTVLTIGILDHVSRNYNEGWNAYKAQAVLTGDPLYPTWDKPWVNNYPPLSFYIVAALSLLTHDVIVAGRILSLAGILASGLNVGLISGGLTGDRRAGLVAALFFLMAVGVWFHGHVGMNDPQWLAHGVQTTGALILFARLREPHSLAAVVVGAALMFLGCLIKHNVIVLPLTIWGFLFVKDRKAFVTMTCVFAVLGCAFLAFAAAVYGGPFFEQMFLYQRAMRVNRGLAFISHFSFVIAPALVFAALTLALSQGVWKSLFPSVYVLVGCVVGGFALQGEGVNYNVLFDVVIAMALTVGSLFDALPGLFQRGGVSSRYTLTLSGLLLFTPIASMSGDLYEAQKQLRARPIELPQARSVVAALADAKGPVACEMLAWCFWAGKPMAYDALNMAERAKWGGSDQARFTDQLANGYFAAVETQSNVSVTEEGDDRAYWAALTRNYRKVISEPTEVWVRKAPEDLKP